MDFQIIYERGTLSQSTLKILNGMLPSAIKEPLQKDVQFWSATKILKVKCRASKLLDVLLMSGQMIFYTMLI